MLTIMHEKDSSFCNILLTDTVGIMELLRIYSFILIANLYRAKQYLFEINTIFYMPVFFIKDCRYPILYTSQ